MAYYESAYGSCPLYNVNDGTGLVAIPSPMQYYSCIKIVKDRPDENDAIPPEIQYQRGRKKSTHFHFSPGIEIHANHHQTLLTKQYTPKLFRGPPNHPGMETCRTTLQTTPQNSEDGVPKRTNLPNSTSRCVNQNLNCTIMPKRTITRTNGRTLILL